MGHHRLDVKFKEGLLQRGKNKTLLLNSNSAPERERERDTVWTD